MLLLGLVLAAVSLAATGCGASADPVARAAARTSDVSGLRFSMVMKIQGAGVSGSMTASGATDSAGHLELTMDLSDIGRGDGPGARGTLSIVEDGTSMYVSGDGLERVLPDGKKWGRIDLSRAVRELGLDVSMVPGGQTDPRTSLDQLREAGNVVEVGAGTVRGVATTRYSVLLDLRKGLDRLDAPSRKAMVTVLDRIERAGGRYVPADVWIDGDGYVRRFRAIISNYLGSGVSLSLSMDIFDPGSPVTIVVPPESQVADLTNELEGLSG
jgi:hypothetical protein